MPRISRRTTSRTLSAMVPMVRHDDREIALASWRSVFVQVSRLPIHAGTQQHVWRTLEAHWNLWRESTITLVVLEPAAIASVPASVREDGANMVKRFPSRAVSFVIEGSSFRVAAARTILAGVNLISRAHYEQGIFSTLAEGCAWLRTHEGHEAAAMECRVDLVDFVASLRSR